MLPLLGFNASDALEFGLAVILAAAILLRGRVISLVSALGGRTTLCMLALSSLPIVLRLALIAHHPVPVPRVADDFSYVLLGDTLAHFRLANPEHPMHRFFEGVFTLQEPSWSSIYPMGQGVVLAFGELVFRLPWAGVLLSAGLLCALCYWMLRAWTTPEWALVGGLLAAIEFGPLSSWMNSYWGGAVSGIAGCLVFGALPRLLNTGGTRNAVLLGVGLGLQLLTRPFEFVLLLVIVFLFFVPLRSLALAALVVLPALGLTLLQNKQVTGGWATLPYQLSRYQYGVPTTFTFQANPVPHRSLTVEQQIDYDSQAAAHGPGRDSLAGYVARLGERVRFSRFFFLAPLYLALPAFLFALKETRFLRVAFALALFWLGDAFYPYFYPHYIAAATCLFVLVTVKGLEHLSGLTIRRFVVGREAVTIILAITVAHFLYWYGIQFIGDQTGNESWGEINYVDRHGNDSEGRIAVHDQLVGAPGRQLVFVRYSAQHGAHEWIQNAADIDGAPIVWAIDLGPAEDSMLRRYYPDRHAWLLEPDAHPPKLTPLD
jgi:hypothetical protein